MKFPILFLYSVIIAALFSKRPRWRRNQFKPKSQQICLINIAFCSVQKTQLQVLAAFFNRIFFTFYNGYT